MKKLVKEQINETYISLDYKNDVTSLLWDFWNQSRVKNSPGKDFHDSENDFNEYCLLLKNDIDRINACLKKE